MKVRYFGDTDPRPIECRETEVSETRDLDENTLIDIDREGQVSDLTMEYTSMQADILHFSFGQIPAPDASSPAPSRFSKYVGNHKV